MRKTRLNWREVSEEILRQFVQARHQRRGAAGRGITDGDIELVGRHLHLANQHPRIGQQGADLARCLRQIPDVAVIDHLPDLNQVAFRFSPAPA
jgi:hypothetical protein